MIIAIDGPAGAGKSTVARGLAKRLKMKFLDTGAMYRAVALHMLNAGVDLNDHQTVAEETRQLDIFVDGETTRLNGVDVSREIRGPKVSIASSQVAAIADVRKILVELQRKVASGNDFVCEGRDQGSVVFPDAEFKFFVTASIEGRARRRLKEMEFSEEGMSLDQVIEEQKQRDHRDSTRAVGALVKADDALEIHTDEMSIEQVIEHMIRVIRPAETPN